MKVKTIDQKGQVLIFVSLAFVLLGLLAGLGIDLGRGYLMKAQLMRTADAAALAGAKALKGQFDFQGDAVIAACDAAEMNGLTCGQGSGFDMSVSFVEKDVEGGPKMWFVEITANASIPTTLLSLLNLVSVGDFSTLNVSAFSQGGPERPVDLMLVLDRSGSMNSPDGTGTLKINALKTAVNEFLDNTFSPDDRVGMVSFAWRGCGDSSGNDNPVNGDCTPDKPLGTSISALKAAVSGLCEGAGCGGTNTMESLRTAGNEINTAFSTPGREQSRKAILLVTDGQPTYMKRSNTAECTQNPRDNTNLPPPGDAGAFPSGCLHGVPSWTDTSPKPWMWRRPNSITPPLRIPASPGTDPQLYRAVIAATRSTQNGAMYEANKIRNYGGQNVVIFAIAIGTDLGPNAAKPQESLDANAKCLLARIANDPTTIDICKSPVPITTTVDDDTHADLVEGWPPCGITPCIDQSQEQGKVFTVDVNGDVQAQLKLIFAEVAAILKLRLTI